MRSHICEITFTGEAGGTTRAALDVLMADDGLEPLIARAVAAAAARSRALAD